jgi:hypothetical protein
MTKLNAASGQRDRFACSLEAWLLLQELGSMFGWQPQGTVYLGTSREMTAAARHNYEPGNRDDRKCVEADDARAWADALRAARESEQAVALIDRSTKHVAGGGASAADTLSGMAPFVTVLHEFIEYARTGAFTFAL